MSKNETANHLSMADVMRTAGVARHKITYAIERGRIPEPTRVGGNRRCFTPDQAEQIRGYFEAVKQKRAARKGKEVKP